MKRDFDVNEMRHSDAFQMRIKLFISQRIDCVNEIKRRRTHFLYLLISIYN